MADLTLEHVSKRYVVRRANDAVPALHPWIRRLRNVRARKELFWALSDVSFGVERGETLGIIGHNGAGKSTILKLLAGITTPTSGKIVINGRLSALIEVGSGFHPELTGRENIFLNGAILGMTNQEISHKLDKIVEFAGVRPFLDVPVKRFSSGMYVRLGFSIAAHLDPDILLLDEVLAVGDAAFQEKCLRRIGDLKRAGTTIVFISHDLSAVERICDRVLLLHAGELVANGYPADVLREYERRVSGAGAGLSALGKGLRSPMATTLTFVGEERENIARTGSSLTVRIGYATKIDVADAVVEVLLYSPDSTSACQLTSEISGGKLELEAGTGHLVFTCPELSLRPGLYYADVTVKKRGDQEAMHSHPRAAALRVDPGKVTQGSFYQSHSWAHAADDTAHEPTLGCSVSL